MYEEYVNRGAKWLDQMAPGWEDRIDIHTLNLELCDSCVLGHIFGDEASGHINASADFAFSHGFNLRTTPRKIKKWYGKTKVMQLTREERKPYFKELTGDWIREILRRRASKRIQEESIEKVQAK